MTQTLLRGAADVAAAVAERTALSRPGGSPAHRKAVAEATQLFALAASGNRNALTVLAEAMSTSDFSYVFGDVLSRSLAQRYAAAQPVWQQYSRRTTVRDFRATNIVDLLGGNALLERVAQHEPYPRGSYTDSQIQILVAKYGRAIAWSWEMGVNDDLGAFQAAPGDLATAATRTEDYLTTSVLATVSGPASWLGTPKTTALSAVNLEAALQIVTNQVDDAGNPVEVGTPILMVPTALLLTAQNIISTTQVRTQTGTGSGSTLTDINGNGLSRTPKLVENRWLTVINKDAKAPTTWFLVADPNSERPSVFTAFLRGHETPDLRQKASGSVRPGGGAVDPNEGDHEHDDVEYRMRHVVGAAQGYVEGTFVSTGS
ncbi:hypothetical protein ACPPVT_07520 [Angustibacter sp. McL0619]|uniref:phage major capsid protein n=1 Tax=Angustibacter sp. McL0619 TaxID=3415676 RepID=UPI003CEF5999